MKELQSDFRISVISNLEGLRRLKSEHNALLAQSGRTGFCSTFAYHYANAKTRHAQSGWRYFAATVNGELVGCLYGYQEPRKVAGLFTIPAFSFNTELVTEILATGEEQHAVVAKLLETAITDQDDCLMFVFERLMPSSFSDLQLSLQGTNMQWQGGWSGFGYVIDISCSSQEFLQRMRRKTVQELARHSRRLSELKLTEFRFDSPQTVEENLTLLQQFIELEDAGWKGLPGTSIMRRDGERSYYEEIVCRGAEEQIIRWYILMHGDKPAAMGLGLLVGKTLFVPKVCFDGALARFSPGILCNQNMILHCLENEDIDTINFVTGAGWLNIWRPEKVEYRSVLVFGKSRKAKLLYAVSSFYKAIQKFLFRESTLNRGRQRPVT